MKKIILNEDLVCEVIKQYENGESIPKLSDKYGINTRKLTNTLRDNNVVIRNRRKFFYDESFFEKIDTKLKAYWLGFLFADGCVRDVKGGYVVKIKLSELDEMHLTSLLKHIGSNQEELRTETSKFKGSNNKEYQSTGKVLLINSKKMVKDLVNLGCVQNKTNNIIFPEINAEFIPSFILGYFDGDGCVTQRKIKGKIYYNITFTSGSEYFLDEVKKNLLNFGIKSISKYNYKTFYRLQIANKLDLLKLKEYFYTDNNFCLERKKIKFNNI